MLKMIKAAFLIVSFCFTAITLNAGEIQESFSQYVDNKGNIILPTDFRSTWIHLGTWVVTSTTAAGTERGRFAPVSGIHDVYTQPVSFRGYNKDGKWPDGTILLKEIRIMKWDDLPTGHVIYEGEPSEWFVMIRDSMGRFSENTNWGEGWGWALFKANNPKKNISTNYRNDCLGCHELARSSDLVFIQGYPILR